MSLHKFITDMLNIKPDYIDKIDSFDLSDGSVNLRIRLKAKKGICCPVCGGKVHIHGYSLRKLIHSTLVNRKCTIFYEHRRFRCDSCELTFFEENPFINSSENVTFETKVNVLKDLKFVNNTYTSTAARYHLSATKVQRIFDAHVDIPRKPLPEVLSIDEHHFPESSYDSLYCCLLMDFEDGTIIDVLPDRKKDYLASYFTKVRLDTYDEKTGKSELDNVRYVSIDLYEPYKLIAQIYFPKALICADPFHVLKHLNEAFRAVRLRCRRNTEDENLQYLLTKFKHIFSHGFNLDNDPKYNKRFKRRMNYRDMQTILFERFPDLKKAYELKEGYILFNESCSVQNAKEMLADQIQQFGDSGISEYAGFYNLLINWNEEIIHSFSTVSGRRINNSYIESRNNQLERLMMNANGFRNFKRTRNRILYCLNKKDTYKI